MGDNREVIFLLGAGSAADAELPTATGLTGLVEKVIEKEYETLLPALRFVKGAVQFGRACRGEPLDDRVNIEELLTACSFLALRDTSYVYPFVSAWHERINKLQRLPNEIQSESTSDSFQFLTKFCKDRLRSWLAVEYPAKVKYLWGFRDFINAGYKLRIFTLNYDECIEHALSGALGDINTRWTTGFGETGWEPRRLVSDEYEVYVYKLHGSLDWVNDPKLGICSVRWPRARDTEELPSNFERLLIFGADIKLQTVDPFLTLLFHFQQALSSSGILIVIGYSFGDAHINAMVLEALQRDLQMRCIIGNTAGLEELLPRDSEFRRLIAVEQRFIELKLKAREAFESNKLLNAVEDVFKTRKEEPPF